MSCAYCGCRPHYGECPPPQDRNPQYQQPRVVIQPTPQMAFVMGGQPLVHVRNVSLSRGEFYGQPMGQPIAQQVTGGFVLPTNYLGGGGVPPPGAFLSVLGNGRRLGYF